VLPSFLAVVELSLTAFGSGFFSIAFASCTSLTSVLALSFGAVLAAGFGVVLAGVALAVVAVPEEASGVAAPALRPSTLKTSWLGALLWVTQWPTSRPTTIASSSTASSPNRPE